MKKIIMVLLTVLAVACNSEDKLATGKVAFTLISEGSLYGGGGEGIIKENLVITDSESWTSLTSKMDAVNNVSDTFTETDIDFAEFMVIAVFDAVKSSGGYKVSLEITTDSESVFINRVDEAPEGNATTVITQPYSIVKISITDLPIFFEE